MTPTPFSAPTLRRLGSTGWRPWAVLGLGLAITAWAFTVARRQAVAIARMDFLHRAEEAAEEMQGRMAVYESALRGGVGLFRAHPRMDRGAWADYVKHLDLARTFPGIQGLGFSLQLPDGGSRITLLEPPDARNLRAMGFDMFGEPARREAMARARDTGQPALSGFVQLVQETDRDVQPGCLLYLPLYDRDLPEGAGPEARRAALQGWVYSPFRMRDLIRGILGRERTDLSLQIFDGEGTAPGARIYASPGAEAPTTFTRTLSLPLYGRTWTLLMGTGEGPDLNQARTLLAGGILASLLLFASTASLALLAQQRAEATRRIEGLNRALEARVAELDAASRELARSNEELERFAYVASHDLQEPLRMVSGYTRLLARRYQGKLDAAADEYIQFAVQGAQTMQQLIEGLLALSRVGSKGLNLAETPLDGVVDKALGTLRLRLQQSGAEVARTPLPTLKVDAAQWTQLYQNLLANAVKFHKPGQPPRIELGAAQEPGRWVFWVKDAGIGIDPKHFDRIFALFQRLHTRTEYEGTGIGLSICKRIIARHGGDIWVESTPGEGTTFYFSLPAA